MILLSRPAILALALSLFAAARAQDLPAVRMENGASQLLVHGKPFLVLGGELGNSSAGTAAQADEILPHLARMHFNTVLMPVAWDQIEPAEDRFDFSIPDHWIDVARREHLHLVFLWFGSWKNAFSEYAPAWVKADAKRFPREISAEGLPLEILSPLGEETARADSHAFAALMTHLRERDAAEQTVLMVQVENEIGYLSLGGRDRSARANEMFGAAVPAQLVDYLEAHREQLPRELAAHLQGGARNWQQMFGDHADELFMAWLYGRFVEQVARAGKAAYALPFYMNAQLPAPFERAGEYPSGGPYPLTQAVYRAAAPSIDFYAPDIYWPDFAKWVSRYAAAGNPVFVPEARLKAAPGNALYLYGEARGFGFSPFGVDSLAADAPSPSMAEVYGTLAEMSGELLDAQQKNQVRALTLDESSPRPSQTVALGGFLFRAALSRTWPAHQLAATHGAMLVIESSPNEFLVAGSGLTVDILRDPDSDNLVAGIASIEQVAKTNGQWAGARRLNGDQSNQGRELTLDAHEVRVYRIRMIAYKRTP